MSSQQSGSWQTAGRPRHSHSSSRTPQTRSGTASPNPQPQPSQPSRQDGGRPLSQQQQPNNAWSQQRSSSTGGGASSSNGATRAETPMTAPLGAEETHVPVNGFNAAEVKAFLGRDAGQLAAFKTAEAAGEARMSGAWGSKAGHMANNQPFFVQLAKQTATLEGGGG